MNVFYIEDIYCLIANYLHEVEICRLFLISHEFYKKTIKILENKHKKDKKFIKSLFEKKCKIIKREFYAKIQKYIDNSDVDNLDIGNVGKNEVSFIHNFGKSSALGSANVSVRNKIPKSENQWILLNPSIYYFIRKYNNYYFNHSENNSEFENSIRFISFCKYFLKFNKSFISFTYNIFIESSNDFFYSQFSYEQYFKYFHEIKFMWNLKDDYKFKLLIYKCIDSSSSGKKINLFFDNTKKHKITILKNIFNVNPSFNLNTAAEYELNFDYFIICKKKCKGLIATLNKIFDKQNAKIYFEDFIKMLNYSQTKQKNKTIYNEYLNFLFKYSGTEEQQYLIIRCTSNDSFLENDSLKKTYNIKKNMYEKYRINLN